MQSNKKSKSDLVIKSKLKDNGMSFRMWMTIRLGLKKFLHFAQKHFEIIIYSSMQKEMVDPILNKLEESFELQRPFDHRLYY